MLPHNNIRGYFVYKNINGCEVIGIFTCNGVVYHSRYGCDDVFIFRMLGCKALKERVEFFTSQSRLVTHPHDCELTSTKGYTEELVQLMFDILLNFFFFYDSFLTLY